MKIAVAGLALESASFLPGETGVETFERNALRGPDLVDGLRGSSSVGGGFVEVLEAEGAEVVPLVYTDCSAAGHASDDAYQTFRDEIVGGLAMADDLDGVLIFLHGAMTTPGLTDPETDLLRALRAAVGPTLPVMLAVDLHANLAPETADLVTGLFGFHYSPHTDMVETGRRAARCLVATVKGEIAPVMAFRKVPLVLPSIFTATGLAPLSDIVAAGFDWETREPAILDVSIQCGFAYADVPEIGFSVTVVADGDRAAAGRAADALARDILDRRAALLHDDLVFGLAEGLDRAVDLAGRGERPVVVLEHADRMNDSTWVLAGLIARRVPRAYVPYLWDPQSAAAAVAALAAMAAGGAGALVDLRLGGHSSNRAGGALPVRARVLWAGDKTFTGTGPMRAGRRIDLGPSALLDVDGVLVSVTSHSTTAIDLDSVTQFGLDLADLDLVVLRSKTHFRAVFEPLAAEIIIVDTPDWGPADLRTLPYQHVREGVYPITP
ncbi:MAG: M81 family metallopeptidase [Rhodobacterales bacterium]|nr:M81 family metallopeptidase [Rhodobacterales bacterium]